jgi:hypothetical protein
MTRYYNTVTYTPKWRSGQFFSIITSWALTIAQLSTWKPLKFFTPYNMIFNSTLGGSFLTRFSALVMISDPSYIFRV